MRRVRVPLPRPSPQGVSKRRDVMYSGEVPRDFDSVWGNKDAQSKITLEGGVLTAPKHDGTGGAYYPPGSPGFHSNLQELHLQALTEGHGDKLDAAPDGGGERRGPGGRRGGAEPQRPPRVQLRERGRIREQGEGRVHAGAAREGPAIRWDHRGVDGGW